MRTTLAQALVATAIAAAAPAAAQDFLPLAAAPYGAYADDDAPIPPRRVGGYGAGETVVTTTRIYAPPPTVYAEPRTVVTTRRVIAPAPVFGGPVDDIAVGGFRPVDYPPAPLRRVLKSGPDYGREASPSRSSSRSARS